MVGREPYVEEFDSEIKVSDNSDSYFSDKSYNKTINPYAPNEHLDYSASLERSNVDFDSESLQKKHKKTVSPKMIFCGIHGFTITTCSAT